MPDPYKKQVRDAAATALSTALGSAASVHKHRIRNFDQEDLPAINVKVSSERGEGGSMSAVGISLSLILEIIVAASDSATVTAADLADDLEAQAIAALDGTDLGVTGIRCQWDNNEPLDTDDEAETPLALLETVFLVQLRVAEGDATTIIT